MTQEYAFEEESAGGIILNSGRIAMVRNLSGNFSFPKGHIKQGEDPLEAAYREIEEEVGIFKEDLTLIKKLGEYTRPDGFSGRNKKIHMFLFTCKKENLVSKDSENSDPQWVPIGDVLKKLRWPQDRTFFTSCLKELEKF